MTTDTLNKVQDAETLVNDTRKAELLSKQSSISTSPASMRGRSSRRWAR